MRYDARKALPQTVTVVNRVNKSDVTGATKDTFVKHVLRNCVWIAKTEAQQSGTNTNVGYTVEVQIPTTQDVKFKPYDVFKGATNKFFTLRLNDYVFLGELAETPTPDNIAALVNAKKPNAIAIKAFSDLSIPDSDYSGDGFLQMFASMYCVEGA